MPTPLIVGSYRFFCYAGDRDESPRVHIERDKDEAWYPRLLHGSIEERNDYRFIAGDSRIHWNRLDEDISIKNLILGQPSGESQKSFQRWLSSRVATV